MPKDKVKLAFGQMKCLTLKKQCNVTKQSNHNLQTVHERGAAVDDSNITHCLPFPTNQTSRSWLSCESADLAVMREQAEVVNIYEIVTYLIKCEASSSDYVI